MRCQQEEVYAAQCRAPEGRSIESIEAAQAYLSALVNAPWWVERFEQVEQLLVNKVTLTGRFNAGARWEGNGLGVVFLDKMPVSERTMLHEVAHVCAGAEVGSRAHDPHWARLMLELVYRQQGQEAWQALRAAFEAGGVDFDA